MDQSGLEQKKAAAHADFSKLPILEDDNGLHVSIPEFVCGGDSAPSSTGDPRRARDLPTPLNGTMLDVDDSTRFERSRSEPFSVK